jgi:hypothetical protein
VINKARSCNASCVVLAPAGGNTAPVIARLVQADEDSYRQVIHRFNEMGMLRQPFTRWNIRKLANYLAGNPDQTVTVCRERLRQFPAQHEITFQRTKTWKESTDPQRTARYAHWSSLDPTTEITRHSLASCTNTCAVATPTPATPTSWQPNAANAHASAANATPLGPPHNECRLPTRPTLWSR